MASSLRNHFSALVSYETILWNEIDRRMTQAGVLRLGRLEYLRSVRSAPTARVQDIAEGLGTTVGAASKLTDRLVADGMVERMPHPTDRRSSIVYLTAAGTAALEESETVFDAAIAALLAQLSPGIIESVTQALDLARSAVSDAQGAR
jgi:DNA-binding MarR family transcriptional regulator